MKRRQFLTAASALAMSPVLIRKAFAKGGESERVEALFEAYRSARRNNRPLLVILVPDKREWLRGQAWGEYINHGTETQLAPLSIFEPACATVAELARLAPQAKVKADAVLVVIDTTEVPAPCYAVRADLGGEPDWKAERSLSYAARAASEERRIDGRIAALAAAVVQASTKIKVPPSPPDVDDSVVWENPPLDVVEAHAHWFYSSLEYDPKGAIKAALADVARDRFRDERIPGSYWARSHGCGTRIEGGPPSGIGCGMGHSNRRSVRFLHFYVTAENLRRGW